MEKKDEKPLGDYSGNITKLDQDQMLGQGGGVIFYEVLDEGEAREHLAMPCLLRDRPTVKAAMRKHAYATQEMAKIFSGGAMRSFNIESSDEDDEKRRKELDDKIAEMEEIDTDALLTIAFYSFKRTDSKLKKLDEESGKAALMEWMDELQLRKILEVALGLNRFEIPRMGVA